jgi:hypothetical protein
MSNFNADLKTNSSATPPVRNKVNKQHGRLRIFESTYTVPASGGPAIGDTITWGTLPVGARVLGHLSRLQWSTGAASSTLNVGDAASAARHLAATAITTAGSATPEAATDLGDTFETSDGSGAATDNCTLISTVAGADLAAAQKLVLRVIYVCD